MTSFSDNSEWDLVKTWVDYKLHIYFENAYYPEVIFYLTMERKPTNYRYTIYLPAMCAIWINLISLWLDVRNHLRFQLSSLSFLTLVLIILYLGFQLGFGSWGTPKVVVYIGQMIAMVGVTLLWSAFGMNFVKSTLEVPTPISRALEPFQQWFVSQDIESVQLTENSDIENPSTNPKPAAGSSANNNNLIFVQIADKILFGIFAVLSLILHN